VDIVSQDGENENVNMKASVTVGIGMVVRSAVIWSFRVTIQVDSSHLRLWLPGFSYLKLSFDVFTYHSTYSDNSLPGNMVGCS
jgi:hypothetical protein